MATRVEITCDHCGKVISGAVMKLTILHGPMMYGMGAELCGADCLSAFVAEWCEGKRLGGPGKPGHDKTGETDDRG